MPSYGGRDGKSPVFKAHPSIRGMVRPLATRDDVGRGRRRRPRPRPPPCHGYHRPAPRRRIPPKPAPIAPLQLLAPVRPPPPPRTAHCFRRWRGTCSWTSWGSMTAPMRPVNWGLSRRWRRRMTAAEAKDVMREVAGEISEEMGWTTGEGGAAGGEGAGRTNAGVRDRHRGGPGGRVLAARGSQGPVRALRIQRRGQELMGRISLPSSHVRLAHESHSVVGVKCTYISQKMDYFRARPLDP